ncbi:MAG: peptide-methionine (S)-S-oxide reductase MsrA [Bacteroidaceae bacterium]|nr:peptide-methionine (S)-S-oxide reductase MsrA [Bacteroidaceae bacterium]
MTRTIYLAAGCFWGAEHYLKLIRGIIHTEVGFANGYTDAPTYKEVYTDTTGYAETVRVDYDPRQISLKLLIELYFKAIDPTSLNQQGEDRGTRYRTGIYYTDPAELDTINAVVDEVARQYDRPLVVEVEPLRNFYPAEEYHQDYLDKNPDGYCHLPLALFEFAKKANKEK